MLFRSLKESKKAGKTLKTNLAGKKREVIFALPNEKTGTKRVLLVVKKSETKEGLKVRNLITYKVFKPPLGGWGSKAL